MQYLATFISLISQVLGGFMQGTSRCCSTTHTMLERLRCGGDADGRILFHRMQSC